MAPKPDGKPARVERVSFTKDSAQRIGKVVRIVEAGDRDAQPITFTPRLEGGKSQKIFRICTFTGAWSINSSKTLTFKDQTTTPNSVSVTNELLTIGDACETQVAYIGKIGTAWHLINVQHTVTHVIVGVSLGETALTFERRLAWIPYPGEATPVSFALNTATAC